MREYNGFTGAQRSKAQGWLNRQWKAGVFPRPSRCCACGQTEGVIDAHAEDYSEPFTHAKLMRYPLCFICHMMVHCRFANMAAWNRYRAAIGNGYRFAAFPGRNFPGFQKLFLNMGAVLPKPEVIRDPPMRRPLDGINGRSDS